jgi:hypothetical protein
MSKLTKQEVFKIIKLINLGEYENSLLDFFEELDELILNVTDEEKDLIIKFVKNEISSWNNFSFENFEYDNLLYKNIYISSGDETIIEIYHTVDNNNIKNITTLTLLPSYSN